VILDVEKLRFNLSTCDLDKDKPLKFDSCIPNNPTLIKNLEKW